MDTDLRNEQSDEAVSASLEPKLWFVTDIPKKMEDVMINAIEAVKAYCQEQPFDLITTGAILSVYYRDYEYPAQNENMLSHVYLLGIEYSNATDRHVKNLFHSPKKVEQYPESTC